MPQSSAIRNCRRNKMSSRHAKLQPGRAKTTLNVRTQASAPCLKPSIAAHLKLAKPQVIAPVFSLSPVAPTLPSDRRFCPPVLVWRAMLSRGLPRLFTPAFRRVNFNRANVGRRRTAAQLSLQAQASGYPSLSPFCSHAQSATRQQCPR